MSKPHSLLRDNTIVIIATAFVSLNGVILMPIIINSVGPKTYGGFLLLSSLLGILFGLSSVGTGFKAMRFLPSTDSMEIRGKLFFPQFLFGIIAIALLSMLFSMFENMLNENLFNGEISFSYAIVPIYLTSYYLYTQSILYFRYTFRVPFMTAATVGFPLLHILLILAYSNTFERLSVNVLVVTRAISALVIAIPLMWIVIREIGMYISFYKTSEFIEDVKLGFPVVIGYLVDMVIAGSDRYIIAIYISVTAVGLYAPGYMIGSLVIFLPKAIGLVLPQHMSKAIDSGDELEAVIMLNKTIKYYIIVSIPFVIGSAILGKQILVVLTNIEVAEGGYLIVPIVAAGTVFYGLNIILSNCLFVLQKTKMLMKMNVLAAVVNMLLNIIFIYYFRNIIVAAITTLVSYLIVFIFIRIYISKYWQVDFNIFTILKVIFGSIVMAIPILVINLFYINTVSLAIIVIEVSCSIAFYLFALVVLKAFSLDELLLIKNIIIKR